MAYGSCSTCLRYDDGRCDHWADKKMSSESCNYYDEDYEKTLNERSPDKICSNCSSRDSSSGWCDYRGCPVDYDGHCSHFSYA